MSSEILEFYNDESYYYNTVRQAEFMLTESITTFIESCNDNHYITEASSKSLYSSIKEFFAKIVNIITTGYKTLIIKIDKKFEEVQLDVKLRAMKRDAIANKKKGASTVEIMPIKDYKETYDKFYKKLSKYNKKFISVKYRNVAQIDKDLQEFNNTIEKYTKELDEIKKKKIIVPIDEYIVFLKEEVDKTSNIHRSIKDMTLDVENMKITAEKLSLERSVHGEDVIPAHVGLLKRAASNIANICKKYAFFFIVTVVFLFA